MNIGFSPTFHGNTHYGRPVVAHIPPKHGVYSAQEWARMKVPLEERRTLAFMDTQVNGSTAGLYQTLRRNAAVDSVFTEGSLADPVNLAVQSSPIQLPSEPNVVMAGAGWCGFTKKALQIHKAQHISEDQIQTLDCAAQDKAHPACKITRSFPTYYAHQDGSYKVLQKGFTPTPNKLLTM